MSLYVRHSAWLGAAPDKDESDKSKAPSKTRVQRLREQAKDEEFEPDMPDIGNTGYLLAHLWRAGPTLGDSSVTHTELGYYQHNMGICLSPWECETLRRLSIEYLNESHRATKRDCEAPFKESTDAARLKAAQMQRDLDTFFS